ncbi:MAG: response regulator [bacterium]|nr:response regulator [bacterium]
MARILVIEADDTVRELIRQILEMAGHNVNLFEDSHSALQAYRESPADLVISDIWMPRQNGLAMLRSFFSEYPDIKIIAITSYELDVLSSVLELGVCFIFIKPFRVKKFLGAVESALASK